MPKPGRCPRCGGDVTADAPEGLCPECLYRHALEGPGAGPDSDEQGRSPGPTFVPPAPHELARHFPQLEILELLGQGGMGAVYKARQIKLDRLVAVKILPPEVARDPAFAERFMREARSLARLSHPHIVTVFDFGEADGLFYFSMEFVDGLNVRQLLQAGELTPAQTLQIVPQVCDALRYAHDEGIVHRDIKPENILLDKKGRVKIADFGLAKLVGLTPTYLTLTGSHQVMGTMYYMAPEQTLRSHLVDHRADLYSLGVVFYEMLTGELPLGRFAPPSRKAPVDERLDPIVLRALAREPEHRYQDASELKRDVDLVVAGMPAVLPGAAPSPGPAPAAVRVNWPSVRFDIPRAFGKGRPARGEICRDEESLIVGYEEVGWFKNSEIKEVRIPIRDITSISLHYNWSAGFRELVVKTVRMSMLAGLPAGKHGRGRFLISWSERQAARQLVESVLHPSAPPAAPADPEQARMDVVVPAIGLLVTGAVALLASTVTYVLVTLAVQQAGGSTDGRLGWFRLGALATAAAAGLVILGAVSMLRLRSYVLAVSAAFAAMLPWSPAWILGLPLGIVALITLRKPEVMAAFLNRRRASRFAVGNLPEPKRRVVGKVLSLFRSMGGYFRATSAAPPSASGPAGDDGSRSVAPASPRS